MKLIVHITKDNLTAEAAEELYEEIKLHLVEKWPTDPELNTGLPYLHVNGQIVDKFAGSHETGRITEPGEI